jgi:hypothetical protein
MCIGRAVTALLPTVECRNRGQASLLKAEDLILYCLVSATVMMDGCKLERRKKLLGLRPRDNYTERLPLVREVSANFYG